MRFWKGSGGTLAIRRYLLDVLEALPSFPEPVGFCRCRTRGNLLGCESMRCNNGVHDDGDNGVGLKGSKAAKSS
jgi:hypothetical protein